MKKKKIGVLVLIFLLLILIVSAVIFLSHQAELKKEKREKAKVLEIKKAFSKEVLTTSKKKLYKKENNQYIEVGFIEKDIFLPLEVSSIKTSSDIYFKIQGFDYYIDYLDIERTSHIVNNSLEHFVSTKKITTEQTNLYKEGTLVFTVNDSFTFDVLLEKNQKYYVSFLDDIYYIQDKYVLEEISNSALEKLSVLSFDSSISLEKLEEVLSLLKEQGYSTITIQDFEYFVTNLGKLKEKSVLLLGDENLKNTYLQTFSKYSYYLETNIGDYLFQDEIGRAHV